MIAKKIEEVCIYIIIYLYMHHSFRDINYNMYMYIPEDMIAARIRRQKHINTLFVPAIALYDAKLGSDVS
jgi:hypothetical protein